MIVEQEDLILLFTFKSDTYFRYRRLSAGVAFAASHGEAIPRMSRRQKEIQNERQGLSIEQVVAS